MGRDWNENVIVRPNGLREIDISIRFRVRDLDLPEMRCVPVVERRKSKMHRCAVVARQKRAEFPFVGECEMNNEERTVLEMRKIDKLRYTR